MCKHKKKKDKKKDRKDRRGKCLPDEVEGGASREDVARYVEGGRCGVDDVTPRGVSALMVAARKADKKMAKCLVGLGADATLLDLNGESAFHHLVHKASNKNGKRASAALELLKCTCANAMLHRPNSSGVAPIRRWLEFVELARAEARKSASTKEYTRVAELGRELRDHEAEVAAPAPSAYDGDGDGRERAWEEKLADAFQEDGFDMDRGFDNLDAQRFATNATYGDDASATDVPHETEDEYRRRIVFEMNEKKRGREGVGHPGRHSPKRSKPDTAAERDREQRERERVEREAAAKAASDAIIAEELRKTRMLQAAKAAKDGDTYRAESARFFADLAAAAAETKGAPAGGGAGAAGAAGAAGGAGGAGAAGEGAEGPAAAAAAGGIAYADIPWPPGDTAEGTDAILFGKIKEPAERKKAIRKEQFKWHPDRWQGTYIKAVQAADAERVMLKVTETSKMFNGFTS